MSSSRSSGSDSELEREALKGHSSEIIVCVSSSTRPDTLRWLADKIRGQNHEGGAELVVRIQPQRSKREDLMLHISASKIKLLETAEQMELQKRDKEGRLRDFTVSRLEDFLLEDMSVDDLLSTRERQTIVRHELENIRALAHENHIPGHTTYTLYEGQSILQVYQEKNIITQIYPLHDNEELKKFGRGWYRSFFDKQPIEEIREYFGEGIALYFTFLGYYTTALLFPMLLGFLQLLLATTETVPFFCVFNVVWTTVFLEIWKRRSNELAFNWGTIGMTSLDEPRSNYHGQMARDPVSGKIIPQYPRWKTNAKMYFVSIPIVFVCMVIAFIIMLASFWCENYARTYESEYSAYITQVPGIVYTLLVYIMNLYYRSLATYLTEWENHRTQSQYDRHRVTKLVMFEFVNNFMSLFYIAFIIQDMEMLKNQLAMMLVILQAINHIQEAFLPLVVRKTWTKMSKHLTFSNNQPVEVPQVLSELPVLTEDDTVSSLAYSEKDMERYEGTFDDYLEMFIQFGYIVLFSSVYPIAAFWGVINNLIEIRTDAFKLCRVLQRPMARRVKDIGAWQKAFEIVGALSIMTNCGLLALSPIMRSRFGLLTSTSIDPLQIIEDEIEDVNEDPSMRAISGEAWVLGFVIIEHILLGIRFILHKAIPDRPEWVRIELARKMHESRRALKNERNQKNRNILTRRFKTVHGPHKHNSNK